MTDADMTRPDADNQPDDPDHVPAVEPASPGAPAQPSAEGQGDHDAAEIDQTGGKVANPYME